MANTAIVTGASGGIGRAVARRLGSDGFNVVVGYAGSATKAEEAVAELIASGTKAVAVQADVASAPDVERLFRTALETFGAVDVVVNCAGIMPLRPIAGSDTDVFDKVIATNLRGTFLVLAQAAQHVRAGGRIIAISTSVIAKAFPTYGPYIASKAGVEGLVHVLANELPRRATVTSSSVISNCSVAANGGKPRTTSPRTCSTTVVRGRAENGRYANRKTALMFPIVWDRDPSVARTGTRHATRCLQDGRIRRPGSIGGSGTTHPDCHS
jgi:NADP-dependent 3-hydroxy acid dehydrogenase YdfG